MPDRCDRACLAPQAMASTTESVHAATKAATKHLVESSMDLQLLSVSSPTMTVTEHHMLAKSTDLVCLSNFATLL